MATLLTLLAVLFAAMLAAPTGAALSFWMGWWTYPWAGPLVAFVAFFLLINAALGGVLAVLALSGGGVWSTSPARWMVGKVAFLVLAIPAFAVVMVVFQLVGFGWAFLFWAFLHPVAFFVPFGASIPDKSGLPWLFAQVAGPGMRIALFVLVARGLVAFTDKAKPVAAYVTLPFRQLWRALKTGLGGSASFDGLLDEWLMAWKPGQVILGASLYEPGQRLGKTDDRHLITIASTRSGKGRSCIIPNLLTWPGSVLVIDPKGENAAVTAMARRNMGQAVYILDPFAVLSGLGLTGEAYRAQRFNPLTAIGVHDLDVVEQIGNLADALIIHSEHANPFWDNASKAVLVGIIAHVLAWPKLRDDQRTLGTVRDYISETGGRKLSDMAGHDGVAGLTAVAVSELKRASDSAGGDILTTLATHVKWLDSLAMRKAMAATDFDLSALKHQQATLYLIIPPDYLKEHARFLRLFVTLALRAAGRGVKGAHPMLFIMDEFATLGPLKVVEEAAGLLAGGGVRLWPIIQNLTQLRMYGDNWEVFLANAGQIQLFAVNDQTTARYFSERMGHHMAWRKVRSPGGGMEWVPQGATWFRTSAELAHESSRDSGKALVFYEGGRQALVRRPAYDQIFNAWEYAPNPYQRQAPTLWAHISAEMERDGGTTMWEQFKASMWGQGPVPAVPPAPEPVTPLAAVAVPTLEPVPDGAAHPFDDLLKEWGHDAGQGATLEPAPEQAPQVRKAATRRRRTPKKPTLQ